MPERKPNKPRHEIKAKAKDLVDTLVDSSRTLPNFGRAMGQASNAAREFNEAAGRIGSVIDRDARQGAVDDLFTSPEVRLGRQSKKRKGNRRADGLLDEADPNVENEPLTRARRIAEAAAEMSRSVGITTKEAAQAISTVMSASPSTSPPKKAQGKARDDSGAETGKVREERCQIGRRKLRSEDNTTESE